MLHLFLLYYIDFNIIIIIVGESIMKRKFRDITIVLSVMVITLIIINLVERKLVDHKLINRMLKFKGSKNYDVNKLYEHLFLFLLCYKFYLYCC